LTSQSLYELISSTKGLSEALNHNSLSDSVQDVRIYPQRCSILDVVDTMLMLRDHWLRKVCIIKFLLLRGYPRRWIRIHCQIQ